MRPGMLQNVLQHTWQLPTTKNHVTQNISPIAVEKAWSKVWQEGHTRSKKIMEKSILKGEKKAVGDVVGFPHPFCSVILFSECRNPVRKVPVVSQHHRWVTELEQNQHSSLPCGNLSLMLPDRPSLGPPPWKLLPANLPKTIWSLHAWHCQI